MKEFNIFVITDLNHETQVHKGIEHEFNVGIEEGVKEECGGLTINK